MKIFKKDFGFCIEGNAELIKYANFLCKPQIYILFTDYPIFIFVIKNVPKLIKNKFKHLLE